MVKKVLKVKGGHGQKNGKKMMKGGKGGKPFVKVT